MRSSRSATIDHWLQDAVNSQRSGNLNRAELLYHKVLAHNPGNADALHMLGLIDLNRGEPEKACAKIEAAIASDPTFADFYRSLGKVKESIGRKEDALSDYQKALARNPDDPASLFQLGRLYHTLGNLNEAESCFLRCIQFQPDHGDLYNSLGLVYRAKKKFKKALRCFEKALTINPDWLPARSNLAITLKDSGKLLPALSELQKVVKKDPHDPNVHYNIGLVHFEMGRTSYAISAYKKAIELNHKFAQPHNNMGILMQELGRTEEAIRCFRKAIDLEPLNAKAYYNLGALYKYHEQYSDAINCLQTALQIDPCFALAKGELRSYFRDICKWKTEKEKENESGTDAISCSSVEMFPELSDGYLKMVLDDAKNRSREIENRAKGSATNFDHNPKAFKGKRIVVGYLSNNFRDHPTAQLVGDMFACHDREHFEIKCFSYGKNDHSIYRRKIENGCDQFIDLYNVSSLEAASRIYREETQILVDLNGYVACSRTDICSLRPSPIQVRYLGAAKTTGSSFFDYLIGDRIVTPENQSMYYSEKLVFMPHSYQVNSRPPGSEFLEKTDRSKFHLPPDRFVFCSFSTSYKIDPDLFRCWMRILERAPGSVLWLLKRDDAVEKNLRIVAEKMGVPSDRLIFCRPRSKNVHLSRLQLADLCLDTRVVNGAATTSDALWVGVPVVTVKGRHFASRMSASILTAVGLEELIAEDLKQYENLAITLATDGNRFKALREKLERNKLAYPLFDTNRFVRDLEYSFQKMWEIYDSGEEPRSFDVEDVGAIPSN